MGSRSFGCQSAFNCFGSNEVQCGPSFTRDVCVSCLTFKPCNSAHRIFDARAPVRARRQGQEKNAKEQLDKYEAPAYIFVATLQVERQAERRAGGRPLNGKTNTASRLLRAGRPRVPHHSVVQADCINLRSRRHRFPTLGALVQQLADHEQPNGPGATQGGERTCSARRGAGTACSARPRYDAARPERAVNGERRGQGSAYPTARRQPEGRGSRREGWWSRQA